MESGARQIIHERSNRLRLELKAWEKDFANQNQGRKADREDIKRDRVIADKYKEYNRLRDVLSGKVPSEQASTTPKKRRHGGLEVSNKRQRVATTTPSKTPTRAESQPWEVDPYASPSLVRNLFTPSKKLVLGPTPQKDGQVLGIFDLLQEENCVSRPLEKKDAKLLLATPQKLPDKSRWFNHSRTPVSSSKRRTRDILATPLKDRQANGPAGTPSTTSKMATPSFLKRISSRPIVTPIIEGGKAAMPSPDMIRPDPRRPLGRSLSSMLAALRKMEDDAADDDLEALRAMENDTSVPPKADKIHKPDLLKPESNHRLPLGGFDDEAMLDSEPEDTTTNSGPHDKPLKLWKKKGQKRTTRRVKMQPSRSKPSNVPTAIEEEGSEPEIQTATAAPSAEIVTETQYPNSNDFKDTRNFDSDSHSDYTASEGGTRYKRPGQHRKEGKARLEEGEGRKPRKRKVTTLSSQNFKRLKLRNSGAKGGPGFGSRFRRRK